MRALASSRPGPLVSLYVPLLRSYPGRAVERRRLRGRRRGSRARARGGRAVGRRGAGLRQAARRRRDGPAAPRPTRCGRRRLSRSRRPARLRAAAASPRAAWSSRRTSRCVRCWRRCTGTGVITCSRSRRIASRCSRATRSGSSRSWRRACPPASKTRSGAKLSAQGAARRYDTRRCRNAQVLQPRQRPRRAQARSRALPPQARTRDRGGARRAARSPSCWWRRRRTTRGCAPRCACRSCFPTGVQTSPDHLSPSELHARTWPLIEGRHRRGGRDARGRVRALRESRQGPASHRRRRGRRCGRSRAPAVGDSRRADAGRRRPGEWRADRWAPQARTCSTASSRWCCATAAR